MQRTKNKGNSTTTSPRRVKRKGKQMTEYAVYYRKPEYDGRPITRGNVQLEDTHRFVVFVNAENPEAVYNWMQGENWSPRGERRDLILGLGLSHTSMMVGDVVAFGCAPVQMLQVGVFGWNELR
jgi:hypothetical protein